MQRRRIGTQNFGVHTTMTSYTGATTLPWMKPGGNGDGIYKSGKELI